METLSDDRRAHVRLAPERASGPDGRDLTVAVQMHASGFSGRYGEVGIFGEELRRFVAALEHLERQRAGAATLRSMGPDEFTLTITVADRAGHIRVSGDSRRHTLVAGDLAVLAATVSFALDPSLLPAVIEDFRQLVPVF